MAAKETAAQRKARIRARLAQAETSQEAVTRNVDAPRSTTAENRARIQERDLAAQQQYETNKTDTEQPTDSKTPKISPPRPSARNIASRVIERRQSKPSNYKVHVVTALALTLAVRVLALGPKVAFGGK